MRAARVVAKARKELKAKVERRGAATTIQEATLRNLDAVLKSLPKDVMKELRLESLVEKGYRQGKSLLQEVAKDTEHETKISGFAGILDLRTYAQDINPAVAEITKLSEIAKAKIQEAASISLALGEGEVDTMRRLFGDTQEPGANTPFRQIKISAERISRTVTNSLVNSGKLAAYTQYADEFPELGIVNEWVNVTDFRTSDTCIALVGQKRPPGQSFQGGGFSGTHPPAHPNCRSTLIPVIGGEVTLEAPPSPPTPAPAPVATAPQTGEGLSFEQRKRMGQDAFKTVLTPEENKKLRELAKEYQTLLVKFANATTSTENGFYGDKLDEIRKQVEPYAQRMIDGIIVAQRKHVINPEIDDTNLEYPLSWTDAEGIKHTITLDESVSDHLESFSVPGNLRTTAQILGGKHLEDVRIVYLDRHMGKSNDRNRGWARPESKTINIGGKRGKALLTTMLHEVGHFIEIVTPGARKASMDFIKSQATGGPQPLSELTGVAAYGEDEIAYPDKFISPYVGRLYPGPNPGTEVVSMGLQALADPVQTAKLLLTNPAHLNYALSYVVEGLELPKPEPKPVSTRPPTLEEHLDSLSKKERAKLEKQMDDFEKGNFKDAFLYSETLTKRAARKWGESVARSNYLWKNSKKVKTLTDRDELVQVGKNFTVGDKEASIVFMDYDKLFGEGKSVPNLHISFMVDNKFNVEWEDRGEALKAARAIKNSLKEAIAEQKDGTILINSPIGGPLGKRAAIYGLQGFGPASKDNHQYAVVKDGKAIPITAEQYKKLKPGDEI